MPEMNRVRKLSCVTVISISHILVCCHLSVEWVPIPSSIWPTL